MGVGNYYLTDACTVYIDHDLIHGEDEQEEDDWLARSMRYEDLLFEIESLLSASYKSKLYPHQKVYEQEHMNSRRIIAESGMFKLSIVDWHWCYAVNLELLDDDRLRPLGLYRLPREATRIFDKLHELYPLRERSCAWTSSAYTPLSSVAG